MHAPVEAHEWVSFEDPDEARTWLVDLTFLESPWSCIFGAGCQGVLTGPAGDLNEGCCSYGAHFSGSEDVARVSAAVALLHEDEWQFAGEGRRRGFLAEEDGTTTTALVDDACIFLNRPGFEGGAGCAFHLAAARLGRPHLELKPDVCWQLPLRREDLVEDSGHLTSRVGQWERRHWGDAGEEFHWWCTEAPEAFAGTAPVAETLADELSALMSPTIFALVVAYLDERRGRGTALPHPVVRRREQPPRQRRAR